MLADLTIESYAPLLGDAITLSTAEGITIDVRVDEVRPLSSGGQAWPKTPFSLVFVAPGAELLPQQTFHVWHEQEGAVDLFLVPLGPSAAGMRYEAVIT